MNRFLYVNKRLEGVFMQLLQLQYFLTVARIEHMSQAALELNVSQSSLSKTIARLEEDLGVPLFDRQGRKIKLNAYGEIFAKAAKEALVGLDNARSQIQNLANITEDRVTVSVMSSKILPHVFKSFYLKRPNVKIHQSILPDSVAKERLITGEIELCISNSPITGPDIIWLPVLKEQLELIVPLNHPLAMFDEIDLKQARHERFISYKSGSTATNMIETCCHDAGFEPNIIFEGTELSIVLQMVNEGEGITFYPQYSFLEENLKNTKRIKIRNPDCYQMVGFAWMKTRNYSYVAKQFRKHMIHEFEEINKGNS